MEKFRKKPIEVEAVQFTHSNKERVYSWASSIQMNVTHSWDKNDQPILKIPTLEGEMICAIGDYLIKEPFPTDWRKLYPCKASIFEQTYEITKGSNDYSITIQEEDFIIPKKVFDLIFLTSKERDHYRSLVNGSENYTKEQVTRIVAQFAKSCNTEKMLSGGETMEEAIEEVKDHIDWDVSRAKITTQKNKL